MSIITSNTVGIENRPYNVTKELIGSTKVRS